MNTVIDRLVEVLAATPEPVLSQNCMGAKEPSSGVEVPAIVMSLIINSYKCNGLGRFIRSGDSIVKNEAIIEIKSSTEKFPADLKSLRLTPLPLKKNPSSQGENYSQDDICVRNVTDPVHPVNYKLTNGPSQKDEYKLDTQNAQIIFGKPQIEGDLLEVIHWTVIWRDEILAKRYGGLMNLEIWANSFNETDEISRRLQNKLSGKRISLKDRGFSNLQPAGLEPVKNILQSSPSGSPFSVWRQNLVYKFMFEAEEGGEISSGIPIKQINVNMDDELSESYSIPRKIK